MAYHVNPETGEPGVCSAREGSCPFKAEHYETAEEARKAFEEFAANEELVSDVWPPTGLPKKLHETATFADLLRHYHDVEYDGAQGICLGASAIVSYDLIQRGVPHMLVRGEYSVPGEPEPRDHWWVEASGWILDASRGQFPHEDYRSGVARLGSPHYRKLSEWPGAHSDLQIVAAEVDRCFGDRREARAYLSNALDILAEAKRLMK